MIIVDAHQDLAWNMLTFGRDYTRSAVDTRRQEQGGEAPLRNGDTLLGWSDYQRGRIALAFASLFVTPAHRRDAWESLYYRDFSQAHALYRAQVDVYHRLVDQHADKFRLVQARSDLAALLAHWEQSELDFPEEYAPPEESMSQAAQQPGHPVGLVILMEGAEGVREPAELEAWWEWGVRVIGPAWAGTRYSGGTREPGPLTKDGYALLEGMAQQGFILDATHMDEKALMQSLDFYSGRIISTHANVKALLKDTDSNRHLSDRAIQRLLERQAVMGVCPLNHFLLSGWKRGDRREMVPLQRLVEHIDYICQRAGDARHVGLGSDFDGGFGAQSVPFEIDTVADLCRLVPLLQQQGYPDNDIVAIMGGNWLRVLREVLPV
jgi:membrane dipeptidase